MFQTKMAKSNLPRKFFILMWKTLLGKVYLRYLFFVFVGIKERWRQKYVVTVPNNKIV